MGIVVRRTLVPLVLLVMGGDGFAQGLQVQHVSVPAEFVREIRMPGSGDFILRPSLLHYDRFHDELLVGDSGHNRIVIFRSDGVFRFEFSLGGILTSPKDLTTDPDGFIYVLGSDPRGQVLFRFDFDGVPIGSIDVPETLDGWPVNLRHLACDDDGTVYALDHRSRRILVFDSDGTITASFSLNGDSLEESEGAYALGALCCSGSELYVPIGNFGTVHRYSTDGRFLGSIGHFGSEPGSLNFPVAVEVSPDGLVLVLDRPRYSVVCFNSDGRFLGEFGGKGISPGWFMGPSLLAVSSSDRVIVGQVFRNKIQVCAIPRFIQERRLVVNRNSINPVGGASTPSSVNTAHKVHQATNAEVFE
jgi:hypothetical protein